MNCQGKLLTFNYPLVMGIVNITQDSFFDGGQYLQEKNIVERIETIISEGADIVDIGCIATNPFAETISEEEELSRLKKVIKIIFPKYSNIIFSIDTYRASIAEYAIDNGINIINDISGGDFDNNMFATVARLKAPYILMHTSGRPHEMQQKTNYNNIIADIMFHLSERIERLHDFGVADIIVDPGFGFGKTIEQNYYLLQHLSIFQELNCPLLVGLSRKSMLYKMLNISPEDALNATSIVNTIALLNGANILRVHDVKEAVEAIKIVNKIK